MELQRVFGPATAFARRASGPRRAGHYIFILLAMLASSQGASAQAILAGNWNPYRNHEDEQDRGPGPDLGDYLGLPAVPVTLVGSVVIVGLRLLALWRRWNAPVARNGPET